MANTCEGILRISKNNSYMAEYTSARGKTVKTPISRQAQRFNASDAREGAPVELEIENGQIAKCVIKGKAETASAKITAAPSSQHSSQGGSFQQGKSSHNRPASQPHALSSSLSGMGGRNASLPGAASSGRGTGGGTGLTNATAPYNFIPYERDVIVPCASGEGPPVFRQHQLQP